MSLLNAREALAARFFLALLIAWVMLTVPYIIGFAGAYAVFPWLTFAPFNTELWLGPLWLLTVRALTEESLPERWWLWLAPGLMQTLYYTGCFLLIGPEWGMGETAGAIKFAFSDAVHRPYIVPLETLAGLSLIAYASWESWRRIALYRAWIGDEHSNAERVDLFWLQIAGFAIIALALMWVAVDVAATLLGGLSYFTNFWFYSASGLVVLWLALQFLARSDRRFPKPNDEEHATLDESTKESAAVRLRLATLEAMVRDGGWHFDQDLTLGELARRLGTNSSTLSATLNAQEDTNFTSLINGLRVDAVCERLRSTTAGDAPNLLDLALDCGFGSKATFNRAFKRRTGRAPSEWLAQHHVQHRAD
ncbi:MAG: AraC family transcriptional regulator [Erythrobacter sp.]